MTAPPRLRSPAAAEALRRRQKAPETTRAESGLQEVERGLLTLATMPASCMRSRLSRVVFLAMECVLRRARRSRSVSCSALVYLLAASGRRARGRKIRRVSLRATSSAAKVAGLASGDRQDKHNTHQRRAARGKSALKTQTKRQLLLKRTLISSIPRSGLFLSVPQLQECKQTGFVLSGPHAMLLLQPPVLPRVASGPDKCPELPAPCQELPAGVSSSAKQDGWRVRKL